jgi:1-deoxy-D-xylulose-5-phosphate reductoisomerase
MKLPIHYAFFFPERIQSDFKRMSFKEVNTLTFEEPDLETFSNLALAYEALNKRGNLACILNAANEIAVEAFLKDKITFLQIAELNEKCMRNMSFIQNPTLEDYVNTDIETRKMANSFIS